MSLSVSINPHTREQFFQTVFEKHPDLEAKLITDFISYKSSRGEILPCYFGKDVAYTQPEHAYKVGLMHIHLCLPPNEFDQRVPQFSRVCKNGDPENDICLVYVQSEYDENCYSLLAIFSPDAHGKARQRHIMNYLCRIAQEFIDNN